MPIPKFLKSQSTRLFLAFISIVSICILQLGPVALAKVAPEPPPAAPSAQPTAPPSALQKELKNNPIVIDLQKIVDFLSGLVGIVIVGSLIFGAIQYIGAGEKPEAVSAAKKRMVNAALALGAFMFIFAFLQWLIPGGVFG